MEDFWVSADHHLGHKNMLIRGRPFSSVEEMDEVMIERHNKRVGKRDHIIFVGDWCASNDEKYVRRLFEAMNGQKHLIPGNHYSRAVLSLPWATPVKDQWVIRQKSQARTFVLNHFASHSWDRMYKGSYLLFGHTHGKLKGHGRSIDVGVDSWGYQPVSPDEAILAMKKYNEDFNDYVPEQKVIQRYHIHEDDAAYIHDDGLDGRDFLQQNLKREIELGGLPFVQTQSQEEVVLVDLARRQP